MENIELTVEQLRARSGTKWHRYPDDVLPAWVADMDFAVPDVVHEAVRKIVDLRDYGYGVSPGVRTGEDGVAAAFRDRMADRFDWTVEPAHVLPTGELVQALFSTVFAFSDPGDGVIIQTPIYPPFHHAIHQTGRVEVDNPLRRAGDHFEIDFDHLRSIITPRTKVWLLCSPHNPTGRVWTRDELQQIAKIVVEHDLIILSDEIHADLVYPGHRHTPLAMAAPEIAERTITITSATKSFNIPGLRCALMYFGSDALRHRYNARVPERLLGGLNHIGVDATVAAWRHGQAWLDAVLERLSPNRDTLFDFVKNRMPGAIHYRPQGTYLAWIDCTAMEFDTSPYRFFLDKAKVALNDGIDFGARHGKCIRFNFGTSASILAQILERMDKALSAR
jgi:cystathionine beta-lyase